MSAPLVSICLPNLNTIRYLPERIETVLAQTYPNWELVVSDNYSDDGAWAFFQELARRDDRVVIDQAPRDGMYANWNRCVERARGEYVYIATSDDTMAADALEKMVAALQNHRDCDLAHCMLRKIDSAGRELASWWREGSVFALSSGSLLDRPHVRRAPIDGLLHLGGGSVYISITQLLIRRSLFDRVGLFDPRWGSVGDFNWNMRAGLVANTVHVPETWGGWRVHPTQATAAVGLKSAGHAAAVDEMIDHALAECAAHLPPRIGSRLVSEWAPLARELRAFNRAVDMKSRVGRWASILVGALAGSAPPRMRIESRVLGRSFANLALEWLDSADFGPPLVPQARAVGALASSGAVGRMEAVVSRSES